MSVVLDSETKRYFVTDDKNNKIDEVDRYLSYVNACGKSPNTIRNYAYHLNTYISYCQMKKFDYLKLFDNKQYKPIDFLTQFMTWLQYPETEDQSNQLVQIESARSNKTINIIIGTVLSFYDYLYLNNDIFENPIYTYKKRSANYQSFLSELMHHNITYKKSILKKREINKPVEAITRKQFNQILNNCNLLRDKIIIALMFECGLRLSEVLGIHLCDLSRLEEGIIEIVPRENNENNTRVKNNAGGIVKLPDYLVDALLVYMNSTEYCNSAYLFVNESGRNAGKAINPDTIEKLFLRISDKVGYKVHPHMLRHGFATEKLEAGWQLVDIQAYLRHKSITSTQIYAKYSDELKKEKMREFLNDNDVKFKEAAESIS